jgi:hypothetical protein
MSSEYKLMAMVFGFIASAIIGVAFAVAWATRASYQNQRFCGRCVCTKGVEFQSQTRAAP